MFRVPNTGKFNGKDNGKFNGSWIHKGSCSDYVVKVPDVTMTRIYTLPPPELVLRFWFTEGGLAMMNQRVGVGTRSAARNTCRTSRSESIEIDNIFLATPLLLPMDLVQTFWGFELVSPGFSGSATIY